MLDNLNKYNVLLASKSPRRRELLHLLRVSFGIVSAGGYDESFPAGIPPLQTAQYVSERKAQTCMDRLQDNDLVITADTMVILGDRIMGKPHDAEEAMEMLMAMSGKTHIVTTGVTIATKNKKKSFTSITEVTFAPISKEDAEYYITTYSPFDKAGAYGIQEWIGAVAVSGIKGSYYNVMGLPVHQLYNELKAF
ncbi:MAG: septum formation protein Maf [Bacteroidales bacterium]|nr:septum formation protein Maf [Bacteroidales bacterium]